MANPIANIEKNVGVNNWHHVREEENPADLPTKIRYDLDLAQKKLWWNDPQWFPQAQSFTAV